MRVLVCSVVRLMKKISIADYYLSTLKVITMLQLINTKAVGDHTKKKN